jgi:tripartite-type tricarboxylate transporter receptor subunit TctC
MIDRFHGELVKAINAPDIRSRLTEQFGMTLVVSSPEALQKFAMAEAERWGKVVRDHRIRAD